MPYKCPVCEGRGNVAKGFYMDQSPLGDNTGVFEQCRTCKGVGIVWRHWYAST